MVAKLRFVIDENGEVQLSVEGATGGECEALSAPFEAALGTVAAREYKDSYYVAAESEQRQEGQA
jgi:hypothetical protein